MNAAFYDGNVLVGELTNFETKHLRVSRKRGEYEKTGGFTLIYSDLYAPVVAKCNVTDTFSKRTGVLVALQKWVWFNIEKDYIIESYETEENEADIDFKFKLVKKPKEAVISWTNILKNFRPKKEEPEHKN